MSGVFLRMLEASLRGYPGVSVVSAERLTGEGSSASGSITTLVHREADVMVIDMDPAHQAISAAVASLCTRYPLPVLFFLPEGRSFTPPHHGNAAVRQRPDIALLAQPNGLDPVVAIIHALASTGTPTARQEPPVWGHSRRPQQEGGGAAPGTPGRPVPMVVMGASTGGPQALRDVLSRLPGRFAHAVAIVQHISPGFTQGFVEWLSRSLETDIAVASDGETVMPGEIRVAPAGYHMIVTRGCYHLTSGERVQYQRPSVDVLFASAAEAPGPPPLGVLLTGMGKDGAEGCRAIIQAGGHTVVQDRETSVVWGMPGAAVAAGGASEVLPLGEIGGRVAELMSAGLPIRRSDT